MSPNAQKYVLFLYSYQQVSNDISRYQMVSTGIIYHASACLSVRKMQRLIKHESVLLATALSDCHVTTASLPHNSCPIHTKAYMYRAPKRIIDSSPPPQLPARDGAVLHKPTPAAAVLPAKLLRRRDPGQQFLLQLSLLCCL